jgi:hypothetical protein
VGDAWATIPPLLRVDATGMPTYRKRTLREWVRQPSTKG